MNAVWHAIYIETPGLQKLPAEQRERILKSLKLAQDLGAKTAVLYSNDIAQAIVDYASAQNFSRIVMAREGFKLPWRSSLKQAITDLAPHVDLIEIGRAASQEDDTLQGLSSGAGEVFKSKIVQEIRTNSATPKRYLRYLYAALASGATALLATPLLGTINLVNIAMLFLLTVVLVAVRFGRGPSVMATVIGVMAFDFFLFLPDFRSQSVTCNMSSPLQ